MKNIGTKPLNLKSGNWKVNIDIHYSMTLSLYDLTENFDRRLINYEKSLLSLCGDSFAGARTSVVIFWKELTLFMSLIQLGWLAWSAGSTFETAYSGHTHFIYGTWLVCSKNGEMSLIITGSRSKLPPCPVKTRWQF